MRPRRSILVVAILAAAVATQLIAGKKDKNKDASPPAASSMQVADVVAYVNDTPITLDAVDEGIAGRLAKVRQDEYDLRRSSLDGLIGEMLLESEAKTRGVTVDELLQTEVTAQAGEPTPPQIEQYYNANKARDRQIQGKSLEQATPMIRSIVQQQLIAARRNQYIGELEESAKVRVMLEPPRAKLTIPDHAPTMGPADAPIVLVEFSDYQCPYCKRAQDTVDQLLAEYGDKIRLVYVDFPLAFHQRAMPASVAALCAGEQEKYWEFHKSLLTVNGNLSDEDLNKRAQDLQLDLAEFAACYDSDLFVERVETGMAAASALGVTGTPTFFVNGRMMVGAQPFEQFKVVIDDELQLAQSRVGG